MDKASDYESGVPGGVQSAKFLRFYYKNGQLHLVSKWSVVVIFNDAKRKRKNANKES